MPLTSRLDSGILPTDSVSSVEIENGTIINADINASAAIDATKIHDGSISNTEFSYLNGVTSAIQTQIDAKQPLDSDLTALAAQTGTNTFPVRTGAGTISEVTYESGTFTPTVTLVGGAGNTVPVYTTNLGFYVKIGSYVWIDILLDGDGGAEGAGTGQINIALPFTASALYPSSSPAIFGGAGGNGGTVYVIGVVISQSATTASLGYLTAINTAAQFTGDQQNNTTRNIRIQCAYRT